MLGPRRLPRGRVPCPDRHRRAEGLPSGVCLFLYEMVTAMLCWGKAGPGWMGNRSIFLKGLGLSGSHYPTQVGPTKRRGRLGALWRRPLSSRDHTSSPSS